MDTSDIPKFRERDREIEKKRIFQRLDNWDSCKTQKQNSVEENKGSYPFLGFWILGRYLQNGKQIQQKKVIVSDA